MLEPPVCSPIVLAFVNPPCYCLHPITGRPTLLQNFYGMPDVSVMVIVVRVTLI